MVSIIAVLGAVSGVALIAQTFIPPLRRESDYFFNRILPNAVPTPLDSVELLKRGLIDEGVFYAYLQQQGYNKKNADFFRKASETQLSPDAILVLYWRGEITKEEYNAQMKVLGYTEEKADSYDLSRKFYPSPTDLVIWQAKEVFEEDAVIKYGLDNEFDLIDKEAFYKAGMSDEQIKNYWRAHWQHPSLTMIYEMLHRGLLTQEDVYEYYRLVEIPPYWRQKLTDISYPPYTRVDTRRMYEMGVLSREQVKRNYLDLGYNEEKAENMTEFTVAYSRQKDKDLTRTQIEKAYEYGIIDEVATIELLMKLGYDEEESQFIIGLKAYAIMESELDQKVSTVKTRFRRGLITEAEAIAALDIMEISPVFRDKTIAEILRVKQTEFQLPSKADIANFFMAELITEDEFIDYMGRLGFQETEINLYLESFKL